MSETTYSQRYSASDTSTAGSFVFDTVSGSGDVAVSKLAYGVVGSLTYVSTSNPLPISDAGGTLSVDDGGSTISIDDGAGSLTVDGTVAISGTVAVTDNSGSLTIDNAALSVTGGGVEASAMRVTIASDSTGVLSVDDNGGSITVDGTVAATQSGTWSVRNQDGSGNSLTSALRGSERALSVQLVDASGNQITTFGGSGGTASTDDAAFTVASGQGTPIMGVVTADSVDSGDVGVVGMLANRQLKVTLYDSGGTELAVGGGTQYTEDAAAAANPVGNALIVVRDDARAGSLTTADGDNVALRGNNAGELYVKHTDTIPVTQSGTWNITNVSGTVSLPTGAATAAKQPALGTAGTASTDVITIQGIASMTAVKVDGSAVTQPVSGTVTATIAAGATTIAKAEDVASADADVGVPAMAVRKATPANTSGTDGDYEMLQISAGRLWTSAVIDTALPAGTNAIGKLSSNSGVTIGAVEIASAQTLATVTTVTTVTTCSTVTTLTGSGIAHDGVDSGNPHKIGMRATTSLSGKTMVASDDRSDVFCGVDGVQITRNHTNLEDVVQERTTNTDGASTAFASGLAAPGSGVRLWITAVTICNSSASFCTVDLRDGSAGSVLWTLPVPATGGVVQRFDPPLKLSANTALAFDASAATSTLTISANGFKSKV